MPSLRAMRASPPKQGNSVNLWDWYPLQLPHSEILPLEPTMMA